MLVPASQLNAVGHTPNSADGVKVGLGLVGKKWLGENIRGMTQENWEAEHDQSTYLFV